MDRKERLTPAVSTPTLLRTPPELPVPKHQAPCVAPGEDLLESAGQPGSLVFEKTFERTCLMGDRQVDEDVDVGQLAVQAGGLHAGWIRRRQR